jgi:hypothetical protein
MIKENFMALPIMATPVLEGDDALRFYKELEESEGKRVSAEEIRRGRDIFNAIMKKDPRMGGILG